MTSLLNSPPLVIHSSVPRKIRALAGRVSRLRAMRRFVLVVEEMEGRTLLSTINNFPTPTAHSGPYEITAGPDGNLWFTEFASDQIGMINPTTHAIAEFPIPTAGSEPYRDHGRARRQSLVHRDTVPTRSG